MRLYENEAKTLFALEGIPVPKALGVIGRAQELEGRKDMSFPIMLKSLVLIGGRGKAGGVRKATGASEAAAMAGEMIGRKIRGYTVERLLVEEAVAETGAACYAGVTMNPADFNVTVIVSPAGGVDIEQVARETPEKVLRIELAGNDKTLPGTEASRLAEFLASGLPGVKGQAASLLSDKMCHLRDKLAGGTSLWRRSPPTAWRCSTRPSPRSSPGAAASGQTRSVVH